MGIGIWQILLILVIVVIIFGAGKLPTMMGDFAKGIKAFKNGLKSDDAEDEDDVVKPQPAPMRHVEPPKAIDVPATAVKSPDTIRS